MIEPFIAIHSPICPSVDLSVYHRFDLACAIPQYWVVFAFQVSRISGYSTESAISAYK